jgi:hypothetical protein
MCTLQSANEMLCYAAQVATAHKPSSRRNVAAAAAAAAAVAYKLQGRCCTNTTLKCVFIR